MSHNYNCNFVYFLLAQWTNVNRVRLNLFKKRLLLLQNCLFIPWFFLKPVRKIKNQAFIIAILFNFYLLQGDWRLFEMLFTDPGREGGGEGERVQAFTIRFLEWKPFDYQKKYCYNNCYSTGKKNTG